MTQPHYMYGPDIHDYWRDRGRTFSYYGWQIRGPALQMHRP